MKSRLKNIPSISSTSAPNTNRKFVSRGKGGKYRNNNSSSYRTVTIIPNEHELVPNPDEVIEKSINSEAQEKVSNSPQKPQITTQFPHPSVSSDDKKPVKASHSKTSPRRRKKNHLRYYYLKQLKKGLICPRAPHNTTDYIINFHSESKASEDENISSEDSDQPSDVSDLDSQCSDHSDQESEGDVESLFDIYPGILSFTLEDEQEMKDRDIDFYDVPSPLINIQEGY